MSTSNIQPRIAALLLAAGSGTRMRGRDKLLEQIDGQSILRRLAIEALNSSCQGVFVVIPTDNGARKAELNGLRAEIIRVPDCAEGMAASIRAGVTRIGPNFDAVILLLADMPEITAEIINQLISVYSDSEAQICRATTPEGTPGHPVLFDSRFFEPLLHIRGDRGARDVIRAAQGYVVNVSVSGSAATTDLDTPGEWEKWRASRENP